MRVISSSFLYFALVFAAGFVFGIARVALLVPQFGVRWSELAEMPFMGVVIVWAARFVVRRDGLGQRTARRSTLGFVALLLMVAAELSMAAVLRGQSPGEFAASRDPVSGSVYVLMLLLFAAMPALVAAGQSPRKDRPPPT